VEANLEEPLDLQLNNHDYLCTAGTSGGMYHSDCYNVVDGCFDRVISLALGLRFTPISLRDILASTRQHAFSSLLPADRRQPLRDALEHKFRYMESQLRHAGLDTMALRTDYEIAGYLLAPIHRIPVELLELIFSLIPDEQTEKYEILERTCRRWKEVVLSLWRPLKLATWTALDEVQPILHRGNRLLGVTVDPSSDATDRPIGSSETERYAALWEAVSRSISRWRTLDILSLPNPQQIVHLGEQGPDILPVPMDYLRSFSIPIRHDSSRFLDHILPSIGAITSVYLTEMHLCSTQAMLYLAQLHCAKVFTHLTSFKCLLPQIENAVDILPHFSQLAVLEVSGLRFPAYPAEVELPLTKTLRRMSLRGVPIGWMSNRKFLRLESCKIISPPGLELIPITHLPLCMELYFESPRLDALRKFHIPSNCTLTLRSPQWNKSRGNAQLSHLWGAVPNVGLLRLVSFHLHLACSSELLVWALCFMPELKELVLELDRPNALGRHFFVQLLPPSSRLTWRHKQAPIQLRACPLLGVLQLKYQRWFRPGESNEMPALLALAHFDERTPKLRVWLKNCGTYQERVQIDGAPISGSTLHSLGLLQNVGEGETPYQVVQETIEASLAILYSIGTAFYHQETMVLLSPSIYHCLFHHLQRFALYVDVDQRVLFEAFAHFKHLEELRVVRLSLSSPQRHLPLLKTLKKMQLGTTSLLWMGGCTFSKLEHLEISDVQERSGGEFQYVKMPMCKFAAFSPWISSELLHAFQMPRLQSLDLHVCVGLSVRHHYWCTQKFGLCTTTFHFVNPAGLRAVLSMQPELDMPVVIHIHVQSRPSLKEMFNILMEPNTVKGLDHDDHATGAPKQRLPFCPKLRELKVQLDLDLELELQLKRKIKRQRDLEHELGHELVQLRELFQLWDQEQEMVQQMAPKEQAPNLELIRLQVQRHELVWMLVPEKIKANIQQTQDFQLEMEQELVLDWLHKREQKLLQVQELGSERVLVLKLERKLNLVSEEC
jgi:hypothetical protein